MVRVRVGIYIIKREKICDSLLVFNNISVNDSFLTYKHVLNSIFSEFLVNLIFIYELIEKFCNSCNVFFLISLMPSIIVVSGNL